MASLALGLPMLLAQRRLLRTAGIRADRTTRSVIAAVGVRELAAAGTILGMRHRRVGSWSRVAGDVVDLALLGSVFRARRENTARLAGACAFIAAVLAADLVTAVQLDQAEGVRITDGSSSHGTGAAPDEGGGPTHMRTAVTILASEEDVRAAAREFRWSAVDFASLEASGQARIVPAPGQRGVELHLDHEPAAPVAGPAVSALKILGRSPDQKTNDELRRFKSLIETGVEVRSDKTPESFSSRRQILQRPGRPQRRATPPEPAEREASQPAEQSVGGAS